MITVNGMARPRTKSDPIQFRLPLDVYDALVRLAARHDETPAQYVARNIERSVRAAS